MSIDVDSLKIIKYPDPRLGKVCREIGEFNGEVAAVARRMLELMHAGDGIGLAGPQVGLLWRIFVCNSTPGEPENDRVVINPVLDDLEDAVLGEEGCLSLPHVVVNIRRARKCTLRAFDVEGKEYTIEGEDLEARVWQHETDHLSGRLILDYQGPADEIANRRQLKELEAEYQRSQRRGSARKAV